MTSLEGVDRLLGLDLGDEHGPVGARPRPRPARCRRPSARTRRPPRRRPPRRRSRAGGGPRRWASPGRSRPAESSRPAGPGPGRRTAPGRRPGRRPPSTDQQLDAAVAEGDGVAGSDVVEQRRGGRRRCAARRSWRRRRGAGTSSTVSPSARWTPPSGKPAARTFGPGRSASTPTVRPSASAACPDPLDALERLARRAVGQRQAGHVHAGRRSWPARIAGSSDAGPMVATIFVRRCHGGPGYGLRRHPPTEASTRKETTVVMPYTR